MRNYPRNQMPYNTPRGHRLFIRTGAWGAGAQGACETHQSIHSGNFGTEYFTGRENFRAGA